MKRRTALILSLIMILAVVLSACGKTTPAPAKDPVTKDALIGAYRSKAEAAKGLSYKVDMDVKLSVSAMGQSEDVAMNAGMLVESNANAARISGTVSTTTDGKTESEAVETYSIRTAEGFDVYTKTDGKWYKYHTDQAVAGDVQTVLAVQDPSRMEMTETDTEYVITGTVSLADIFNVIMNYMGGSENIAGLGLDLSGLDLSGVEPAKTTYHFDKTTEEPTSVDIDMADCMKGLIDQLIKALASSLMSGDSSMAGIDISSFIKINAERFTVSVSNLEFDKEVVISLPDAAKNAQEAQADDEVVIPDGYGSYGVDELTIWLPGEFQDFDVEGYTSAFASNYALTLILKEDKAILENYAQNMDEYVNLVVQANKSKGLAGAEYENGRPIFEYTVESEGVTYAYYTSAYESDDAFWLVQFACYQSDYATLRPLFVQWADTVSFD